MKVTKFKINSEGLIAFAFVHDNGKKGTVQTVEMDLFKSQLEVLNANVSALMGSDLRCVSVTVTQKKKTIRGENFIFQVVTANFEESRKVTHIKQGQEGQEITTDREIFLEMGCKKTQLSEEKISDFDVQNIVSSFTLQEIFALFAYFALQEIETVFEASASKLLAI